MSQAVDQKKFGILTRFLHHADYAWMLPIMARMPLGIGYRLSALRGVINGRLGRDWRSMALGTRHIARQAAAGYRILLPRISEAERRALVRERFQAESLEEFEGRLIAAGRVAELQREIIPDGFITACSRNGRGVVLLTPHFDSFWLGTVFLAQAGLTVNAMTSAVTRDPRVVLAVQQHFFAKYRGMEHYLNGGRMLDMENGLRPFYQMLERGECLVILADAPAVAGGAAAEPYFLGDRRKMAGGALRMARRTGSDIGAFVCRCQGPGRYLVKGGPVVSATDQQAFDLVYGYLSGEIEAAPGRWCASDLLPLMHPVVAGDNR